MISVVVYQILIFFLFIASAFFSGSETVIISANRYALEEKKSRKQWGASSAVYILNNTERTLSMILIGNNIANIVATAFIAYVATRYYSANDKLLFIITVVQTLIFLLFCEIVPKIFSHAKADFLLRLFSTPLRILLYAFSPVVKIIMLLTSAIKRLLRLGESVDSRIQARNEIETLFQMGEAAGILEENHRIYVDEIMSLHEIKVYQVMTPTIDIISVEEKQSLRSAIKYIDKTKYSRIPVYRDRVDNVTGYIYYKDLYKEIAPDTPVHKIMRQATYVPGSKSIYTLLSQMRKNGIHMVFVVNEYGGVEGLTTREDIAEEIVGEIQTTDHFSDETLIKKNNGSYSIKGSLDIEYFCRLMNISIPNKSFETVAGFLNYKFDRIPCEGEQLAYKNLNFTIESASLTMIDRVKVTIKRRYKRN
ncbi:MAG: hemolysin family protein [Spirochaetes bacterium]|jgi:putative hemolysin|nr:hemolysin family protein [Spirochaetota bacterium]